MSLWVKIIITLALVAAILFGLHQAYEKVEQAGFDRCVAAEVANDDADLKAAQTEAKTAKDASTKAANELKRVQERNAGLEAEVRRLTNDQLKGNAGDSGQVSDTFVKEWNRIVNRVITPPATAASAAGAAK